MSTQAFLHNAVLFTYGLVLTSYYGVSSCNVGLYLAAFAVGNLTGRLTLGRLFDRVGRVPMISGCYFASGAILILSAYLFHHDIGNAATHTAIWTLMFFFASSAASATYRTVSEVANVGSLILRFINHQFTG